MHHSRTGPMKGVICRREEGYSLSNLIDERKDLLKLKINFRFSASSSSHAPSVQFPTERTRPRLRDVALSSTQHSRGLSPMLPIPLNTFCADDVSSLCVSPLSLTLIPLPKSQMAKRRRRARRGTVVKRTTHPRSRSLA